MSLDPKKTKSKRHACQVPQSLNFGHNPLASPKNLELSPKRTPHGNLCKTLPDEDEESRGSKNREFPEIEQFDPNKVLSSRMSSNMFFHYRNSYMNEKIMKFNNQKNQESFRTQKSEYILEKTMIEIQHFKEPLLKTEENPKEDEEEEYKFSLFHEPEIKFTENTEKNFDDSGMGNLEKEEFTKKDENFTVDSRNRESEIRVSEINRNLDFEDKRKNIDFFLVSSSRNRLESFLISIFSGDIKKSLEILEGSLILNQKSPNFPKTSKNFLILF